jgi:hypothetical protein
METGGSGDRGRPVRHKEDESQMGIILAGLAFRIIITSNRAQVRRSEMSLLLNIVEVSLTLVALDALYLIIIKPWCKKRRREPEEVFIRPKIDDDE